MAKSNRTSMKTSALGLLVLLVFLCLGLVLCQQPDIATTGTPTVPESGASVSGLDPTTVTATGRPVQEASPLAGSTLSTPEVTSESRQSLAEVTAFTPQLISPESASTPPTTLTTVTTLTGSDVTDSRTPPTVTTRTGSDVTMSRTPPSLPLDPPQDLQTVIASTDVPLTLPTRREVFVTLPSFPPPQELERVENVDRVSPFPTMDAMGLNFTEQLVWYHEFLCDDTCATGERGNKMCYICHCDPLCFQYGDCCPKVFLAKKDAVIVPRPSCPELLQKLDSYYMVTSCLPDLDLTEDGRKCRKPEDLDWRYELPVTDVSTQTTYRNRYCARCNNVTTYTDWLMLLDCSRGDPFTAAMATSPSELFKMAARDGVCQLDLRPPANVTARPCSPDLDPVIPRCNVTGDWSFYDERVERACAAFWSPVDVYGNAFCRLCNENVVWRDDHKAGIVSPDRVSLVAVLNLQDDPPVTSDMRIMRMPELQPELGCVEATFLDPQSKICRPLFCELGKAIKDGKCRSVLSQSNFLIYFVTVDVTVTTSLAHVGSLSSYLFDLLQSMLRHLREALSFFVMDYTGHVQAVHCCSNVTTDVLLTFKLFTRKAVVVDDTEAALLAFLDGVRESSADGKFQSHRQLSARGFFENTVMPAQLTNCRELSSSDYPRHVFIPEFLMPYHDKAYRKAAIMTLSPLRVCSHVILGPDEFVRTDGGKRLIIRATNMTVHYPNFYTRGSTASVCLETYLAGFGPEPSQELVENVTYDASVPGNSSLTSPSHSVTGVLSLVCSVISLVFLLVTFVVYCLFKELRTTSGVCAMAMVAVLFLAQAVFEFGAEQTEKAGLCVALGVLAHYLWLSATFWMNACTALLFYRLVFPLHARIALESQTKVILVTSLYAFLSPALVVASSMAANFGLHGDLGYGGAVCYIRRASTRRLGLALPIGVLVLVNLTLFLVTLVTLRRGARPSSSREGRVGLAACARLSVLTGLSWLVLFLYEAVQHLAMEVTAILLFGLYGVVAFLSLVSNRHVLALLRERLGRRGKGRKGGKESSSNPDSFSSLNTASTRPSSSSASRPGYKDALSTRL